MFVKITFLMLAALIGCESFFVYSSFWAPLFNPRILNYKVDVKFNPDGGRKDMPEFSKNYGYRGESFIDGLGKGRGPKDWPKTEESTYEDVDFHYTYPGAKQD